MTNENWQGINIKGGNNEIKDNIFNLHTTQKPATAIKYIPHTGIRHFVGRSKELTTIHEKLHAQNNTVAISAVAGMGGVGKTELAVKYAREYADDYSGGVCWLSARDANLSAGIIQFVQLQMGLEVPRQDFQENILTLNQQVAWCWQNWQPPEGLVLIVLDDVTNLEDFSELIPPNNRFRILMTTRLRNIDTNIEEISLDVLSPKEALQLLINVVGEKKVNKKLEIAQELCKWLGYLPLGIELIGRYLVKKPPHFTLVKMLEQLKEQRLHQEAINPQQKTLSTAQRGVLAAFELSWVELSPLTQQVAILLSLFAADIFVWEWVNSMAQFLNWDKSDVELGIEQIYQRHLVQCLEEDGESYYKIHPLIREFLQTKLTKSTGINELQQAFTNTFIEIAKTIPESSTLELINSVKIAIPHLTEIVEILTDAISDENLYWAFIGLARFYNEQGLYTLAEPWLEQCVSAVKSRLGENHQDIAASLYHLAEVYRCQGKYEEAEPLYLQALQLRKQLLGENNLDTTTTLNDLAFLYRLQGKYKEAEPLYLQALQFRKQLLGENNPHVATTLHNLAQLYRCQGRYEEAEPLYLQALHLRKQLLGENHPYFASSLNNLAALYTLLGRYEEAEPLSIQAKELYKSILGENHPDFAISLINLANLYGCQGRYEEAEALSLQALELKKQLLGENYPDFATSLNNLANIYVSQRKYEQAEPLYIQAKELYKSILGENHLDFATSLNNLAVLYRSQEKYEVAEPIFLQSLDLYTHLLGKNHPLVANSLKNLALLYHSQGKYDEAEPFFLQALEIAEQTLGSNHPKTVTIRENLEYLRTHISKRLK